ncbi:D-hexose-6-phosphate mutarotase [Saccharospirillum impatiens]|uniref:D-hexose-6-phosphate mutarotase n=1 Tax=Saccharospirillum impatiens TaxID=169438 RepID=UPI0003FB8261|nr:D-hexose-6-phosphate mutarotase [Saccharospirillum impatiens]
MTTSDNRTVLHRISRDTSANGLQRLLITNQTAQATLYLQGAHLTSFVPREHPDMLWVSAAEPYQPGQAIRGGIPICWPWFGPHPSDSGHPSHGLVRTQIWDWEIVNDQPDMSQVRLWLETDGENPAFGHRARVELVVTVAASLTLSLTTTNLDDKAFRLSQALHSYLPISSPADVRITGLTGYPYMDKLTGEHQVWPDRFTLDREVDRIVQDAGQPVFLNEPGRMRRFVRREGSQSLIVWNPWVDKSRTLSSFNHDDYQSMLCLEAANAGDDHRTLLPGEHHCLTTELGIVTTNDA